MDLDITGLRVLVTAGANGIGLAIARSFAAEGARVHVCDVDGEALAGLKTSDPAITWSRCDVSDRAEVARLFDEALAALGIVGPTRMDYPGTMAAVRAVARYVSRILDEQS